MTIHAVYTKKPKPGHPLTGDNRNSWLWMALLLASGGCLAAIPLHERKRKVITKE